MTARTTLVPALAVLLTSAFAVQAHAQASDTDKAFVAKVSQGGRYEVEASQIAVHKAMAQDVKDLAVAEVHDHQLVGDKLKAISTAEGAPIAPTLNAEFQQKLNHLKTLSGAAFDSAYLAEMDAIHDKDEKLFAQESQDGTPKYKAFAAETDRIVKRHIGALHAV
jgi:putative membrane protein